MDTDLVHGKPHVDYLYWFVREETLQAPVSEILVPTNKITRVSGGRLLWGVLGEDCRAAAVGWVGACIAAVALAEFHVRGIAYIS